MTPEDIAAANTEYAHQAALFCWANEQVRSGKYPMLRWMHAIPNGGLRNKVTASRLVAEGVKRGVADIFLPYAKNKLDDFIKLTVYNGLYIEMKKPGKIKNASEEQKEFCEYVTAAGYKWVICDSWRDAANAIIVYLEGR